MRLVESILISGLAVTLAACGDRIAQGDYHLDQASFTIDALKMVEQRTGLTLPAGSRGLNMFYQGSYVDPSFIAKIEIPASSQESLAKKIALIPNKDGYLSGSLTTKVDWWNPFEGIILTEGQVSLQMDYVHIVLCEEKGRWLLYVEWVKI